MMNPDDKFFTIIPNYLSSLGKLGKLILNCANGLLNVLQSVIASISSFAKFLCEHPLYILLILSSGVLIFLIHDLIKFEKNDFCYTQNRVNRNKLPKEWFDTLEKADKAAQDFAYKKVDELVKRADERISNYVDNYFGYIDQKIELFNSKKSTTDLDTNHSLEVNKLWGQVINQAILDNIFVETSDKYLKVIFDSKLLNHKYIGRKKLPEIDSLVKQKFTQLSLLIYTIGKLESLTEKVIRDVVVVISHSAIGAVIGAIAKVTLKKAVLTAIFPGSQPIIGTMTIGFFLGTIAGITIDKMKFNKQKKEAMKILKQELVSYFKEFRTSLLMGSGTSIQNFIYCLEYKIVKDARLDEFEQKRTIIRVSIFSLFCVIAYTYYLISLNSQSVV